MNIAPNRQLLFFLLVQIKKLMFVCFKNASFKNNIDEIACVMNFYLIPEGENDTRGKSFLDYSLNEFKMRLLHNKIESIVYLCLLSLLK